MDDDHPNTLLREARALYSQGKLADILGVDVRTIRRWEVRENEPPPYLADAIRQRVLPPAENSSRSCDFTFVELFAGIGGMRLAFERQGGRCVFACEADSFAQKTYRANFPADPPPLLATALADVSDADIPDHDLMLVALPYHGVRGTSRVDNLTQFLRVLAAKKPRAFFLGTTKHLALENRGQSLQALLAHLGNQLGYQVHHTLIDARYFVPQQRDCLIILGFAVPTDFSWDALHLPDDSPRLSAILHGGDERDAPSPPYTCADSTRVNPKYTLTEKLWAYQSGRHELLGADSVAHALSPRCHKDGAGILVAQHTGRPRRLTPRECARLMGYPDTFHIPVSDTRAYQQLGVILVIPLIAEVARIMRPCILKNSDTHVYTDDASIQRC